MHNTLLSPKPKKVLSLLLQEEKTLTEIAQALEISKPSTLKYLNDMESLGVVSSHMHKTKTGREKRFNIRPYSFVFSVDPEKGAIVFTSDSSLEPQYPLVGQIEQKQFREVVSVYLERIVAKLKMPFAAVVYGPVARGEATSKSDLDLLLLTEKKWAKRQKSSVMDALFEGSIQARVQAKPLFLTSGEIYRKGDRLTKRIREEGLILYDSIGEGNLWKMMMRYWSIID